MSTDPKHIWLDVSCEHIRHLYAADGRAWCEDPAFDDCEECGAQPTEYIRADTLAAKDALIRELVRVLNAVEKRCAAGFGPQSPTMLGPRQQARAALARAKQEMGDA